MSYLGNVYAVWKQFFFNHAINILKKTNICFKAMINNLTSLFLIPVVLLCICKKECSSDNILKLTSSKKNRLITYSISVFKKLQNYFKKRIGKREKTWKDGVFTWTCILLIITSEYRLHKSKSGLYFKRQIASQLWQL